jgi:sugar lactone lactonase YvrE
MKQSLYATFLLTVLTGYHCSSPTHEANNEENNKPGVINDWDTEDLTEPEVFTSGVEGPAVSSDGTVYAVNFNTQGTIGQVTPEGLATHFVTLPDSSIGNGIRFLKNGNMLIADYTRHNVLLVDMIDLSIDVWAHEPQMNQPNDLAITSRDIVFASDPNWKASTGNLWRVDPNGAATLLEEDMGTTNGVEVSPDESKLYVNESVQRNVWVYDLSESGEISNKRIFIKFEDFGMDGMRCDTLGNLYITRHGKGTVAIVSPEGNLIKEVVTQGKQPTNIAFGGTDGKTCYVTMMDRGNIETFRSDHPGRAWALQKMNR